MDVITGAAAARATSPLAYRITVPRNDIEMLQGTLDVLVLKTLCWGPMHGYAVARWLQQVTDDVLRIEEGSLYPSLHRMERKGWVESEWGLSENNRKAKYYTLTRSGRSQLAAETSSWSAFAGAVTKVLGATTAPAGVQHT